MAQALWREADTIATSVVTEVETRAALASAFRRRRLTRREHLHAKAKLRSLLVEALLIDIGDRVVRIAGDLAEEHALRGYDAIHLASAVQLDADDALVASWDDELLRATRRAGLQTIRV
ncbi:MAG: type II toxin-antitoxin system VapC family toxin [Actinomycetota bacterium]